ncbi:TfuA-like protein [Streptomyces sp. NPDC057909]|uniref:TfuA-like protein n=1 Tax=Streptomyces sp. NPDC057909 TaxID=3346277 RepID=UPI0036E9E8FD
MTVYLFAGPSLPRTVRERCAGRAVVLPPVAAGDLPRLRVRPGDTVGIIDGFFHRRPAVRHKEILDLLASGVQVHGAASMGALRAAELAAFGMIGHGRIFTDYHRGVITADDEVALLHGTEAEDYQSYTEALVNVRYALTDAATQGLLPAHLTDAILAAAARLPFVERTREAIMNAARESRAREQDLTIVDKVLRCAPDAKKTDALALVEALCGSGESPATDAERSWRLRETLHLRQWRSAARGSNDPEAGWVPEGQVHRLAQVLAVDYPVFREHVALRVLAAEHTATRGALRRPEVSGQAPAGTRFLGADSGSRRVRRTTRDAVLLPGEVATTGTEGIQPATESDQETLRMAVVKRLRILGLLAPDATADPGLDRWCTAAERQLPDSVRTGKAAARALFPHPALEWNDPFLDQLKATGAYAPTRKRLIQCLSFHQTLRQQRPTLQLAQLRTENILAHFAQRWNQDRLEDAVLERGFATIEDFVATARSFYLYDKAHPDNPPLSLQRQQPAA